MAVGATSSAPRKMTMVADDLTRASSRRGESGLPRRPRAVPAADAHDVRPTLPPPGVAAAAELEAVWGGKSAG